MTSTRSSRRTSLSILSRFHSLLSPERQTIRKYKMAGRIITEKLDFYTFMYMVIEPARMSLREFNDHYDRLIFRIWSWRRFLTGKCGKLSLLGF